MAILGFHHAAISTPDLRARLEKLGLAYPMAFESRRLAALGAAA